MQLTNTLTRRLEEFAPVDGTVRIYICGITPYDRSHLGHAMSYVIFDVLRRYLEYRGYPVRHVQNFTDIDDKIIARAASLGVSPRELAERHIAEFSEEMRELNVLPPTVTPRATEEIDKMIELVEGLIARGHAYAAEGDVYFRVRSKPDYGKLSGRNIEELEAGARVEPSERKEDPLDFALWKGAKPGEPSWPSPWGAGRPGWHIECSAMALRYLGETLDIHGGGEDLVFPHHENEIAQSEAYTGKPFARFWLHHGWMRLGEQKMSKSLGNIISIREALERYGADAIRLFVLNSHYRSPLTYSEEALQAGRRAAKRLRTAAHRPSPDGAGEPLEPAPYRERFLAAMEEDLNTPRALAALFDLAAEVNRQVDAGRPVAAAQATLRELADLLALRLEEAEAAMPASPFIDLLLDLRAELRHARQYELADRLRSCLAELGVILEDTPQGTIWRRA